jgi:DNA-binding transcriptional ArsR family regulator
VPRTRRSENQPPGTAAQRAEARWTDRRAAELDAQVAERALGLERSQPSEWERRRAEREAWRAEREAHERRIKSLERQLSRAKQGKAIARNTTLDAEILDALGRVPMTSGQVHYAVLASYGDVDQAQVSRHLKRLAAEGAVTITDDSPRRYVKNRRKR